MIFRFEFLQSYLDGIDREGDREPTPQFQRSAYIRPGALGADGIDDSADDEVSGDDSEKEEADGNKSDGEEGEEKSEEESDAEVCYKTFTGGYFHDYDALKIH